MVPGCASAYFLMCLVFLVATVLSRSASLMRARRSSLYLFLTSLALSIIPSTCSPSASSTSFWNSS
ncbi:hypothetical protein B0I72DRAFT_142595 [Yarrowia lipolytica]|nr:hypothetical protein B0I72DRAFT_142595 [Yarrowia lipolytica]